jgi:hypothetical protein
VDDGLDMDIDEEPPAPPMAQRPTLHWYPNKHVEGLK